MSTTSTVELRIAARPENVALARLALAGVASVAGASREEIADLKLAVSEICTNAVLHAHAGAGDGHVVLRYTVGDDGVTVEVEDAGGGFDAAAEEPEPGRFELDATLGLSIARAVTDELRIETDGAGSRIVFSKRVSARADR